MPTRAASALLLFGGLGLAYAPKSCAKRAPAVSPSKAQPLQLKIATCALHVEAPSRFKDGVDGAWTRIEMGRLPVLLLRSAQRLKGGAARIHQRDAPQR